MAQPWIGSPGLGRLANRAGWVSRGPQIVNKRRSFKIDFSYWEVSEKLGPPSLSSPITRLKSQAERGWGARKVETLYNIGKTRYEKKWTLNWGWKTASHLPARRITWINWQCLARSRVFSTPISTSNLIVMWVTVVSVRVKIDWPIWPGWKRLPHTYIYEIHC